MIKEITRYYKILIIEVSNFTGHSLNAIYKVSSYKRTINYHLLTRLMVLYKPLSTKVSVDQLSYVIKYKAQEKRDLPALEITLKKTIRSIENTQNRLLKLKKIRQDYFRGLHACNVALKDSKISEQDRNWFLSKKMDLLSLLNENDITQVDILENKIIAHKTLANNLQQLIKQHS